MLNDEIHAAPRKFYGIIYDHYNLRNLGIASLLHDYKLEGSLFNENAELTMLSNKYRNTIEVGLQKRFNKLQVLTTFNSMSKDTDLQRTLRHPFLKISLSYQLD